MTHLTPTAIRATALAALWADIEGVRSAPLDLLAAAVADALDASPCGDLREDEIDRVCRIELERAAIR